MTDGELVSVKIIELIDVRNWNNGQIEPSTIVEIVSTKERVTLPGRYGQVGDVFNIQRP